MRSERNPFRTVGTLREAMDRLLEDNFVQPLRSAVDASFRDSFPMDVLDAGDRFQVRAALPGVAPEDLQVQVQGDRLTLRATMQPHEPRAAQGGEKSVRWLARELRAGSSERHIQLPAAVVADQAEAQLEHGMLTLTLPKATPAGPRRIEVSRPKIERTAPDEARARQNPSVTDPTKPQVAPGEMPASRPSMATAADAGHKDQVNVESEESFPASDPPSWTLGEESRR